MQEGGIEMSESTLGIIRILAGLIVLLLIQPPLSRLKSPLWGAIGHRGGRGVRLRGGETAPDLQRRHRPGAAPVDAAGLAAGTADLPRQAGRWRREGIVTGTALIG